MNRVSDSPNPRMDLESEILKQLDKITETGNKFRSQILELGENLKSYQDTERQNIKEREDQSSNTIPGWMKSVEIKMQEITDAKQTISEDVRELEKRRMDLQGLVAGKLEDVLKDVALLKSWTETTMELKPKLNEGRRTIQHLESQIEKAKGELKEKLDLLDSAIKSNQNAVNSSLKKLCVPTREVLIDADGWIVIQKRQSGPRDEFNRGWTEYENGFGSDSGNFWLGLKQIHELTADGSMELRIELTDWDGKFAHANYSQFSVGNSADLYRLTLSGFSGSAGDSLKHHDGGRFSTHDKKTGGHPGPVKGGWWGQSRHVNLNGLYYEEKEARVKAAHDYDGVYWFRWKSFDNSLQKVLMKIRQRK